MTANVNETDLSGKVAVVTGAAAGLGRAEAVGLAAAGATVVVNDMAGALDRSDVFEQIAAAGSKGVAVAGDVSARSTADELMAAAEGLGGLDILVNNAGITRDTLLMRMSEEDWDAVLDINLKGAFLVTKAVVKPMMKQRSGAIVNIASVVGIMGNPGQANYTASKAGLIALTKTTAKELGSRNIRVNAVAPGFIRTAMTDKLAEPVKEAMLKMVPLGRLGEPEDVAKAVAFLASDAAAYVNGQTLAVCGGMVW